jgi:hypothetical protein
LTKAAGIRAGYGTVVQQNTWQFILEGKLRTLEQVSKQNRVQKILRS